MIEEHSLKKEIGLLALTSIGIGGVIGSGIFALPTIMGSISGPSFILAILIAGIISAFIAICFAELGSTFPLTGGPYSLPRLAMGDLCGFIMGWGYYLHLFTSTAAILNIFVVYLGFFVPGLSIDGTLTPFGITIAVCAIWVFTFINIVGVKWGSIYSIVTTIGKIIPLLIFAIAGLVVLNTDNFTPFAPYGYSSLTIAVAICFWSFIGFEGIVVPAGEVKNPAKNVPLAMLLTILATIIVYMAIGCGFIGMIDWAKLGITKENWTALENLNFPLAAIANTKSLSWLAFLITIGAIISTGGTGGVWILVQGRMPYAMAKDKLFIKSLAKISPKYNTPVYALLFSSALSSIVLITIPHFPSIAMIAAAVVVLPSAAACICLPILRKTKPETKRAFKLPFYFPVTLIGFVLCSFLLYWVSWPWTMVSTILILSGFVAFLFVRKHNWEFSKSAWLVVYMIGITLFSYIGDPEISFNNFLGHQAHGLIKWPYDLLLISIFAIMIYFWAYFVNIKNITLAKPETI
jgi:basic amino acid/polyamine antiporter, APA family